MIGKLCTVLLKLICTNSKKSLSSLKFLQFAVIFHIVCYNIPQIPKCVQNDIPDISISVDDVEHRLSPLNVNKSPGPDNFHLRVLKELSHELSVPLSRIYKTSLSCRILPVNWKMANIKSSA